MLKYEVWVLWYRSGIVVQGLGVEVRGLGVVVQV